MEYHTVLIPFCDWKLENETNNQLVWCTPDSSPYNHLDLVPVTYGPTMASSAYRSDYLNERLQLWVDNLNLLYVAFTRASKNLVCWSRKGYKNTVADLLAEALPCLSQKGIGTWNDEENIYSYGQLCSSDSPQTNPINEKRNNRLTDSPKRLPIYLATQRPDIEFRQSNRSADFIAGREGDESPQRYIDRGQLLHTLFSTIDSIEDIDQAVDHLVFEGIIADAQEEEKIRSLTRHAFTLPQVQDWYSGRWTLYRECNIIWMENGELHMKRPDRVMMDKNGCTIVVDFKFGKPRRSYAKQVQEYIDLLVQMGQAPKLIEGYLWYVDEDRIERV